MKPLWQIRKRQSVHRTKRYVSSSWIVPLPMRTGSNPISDLRIASCYISIAAYRKANRSVHLIWRQVKMSIQFLKTCYARVFSLSCHNLVAYVVEGDVQQPFHLSLVLRLLRSVQVFVGSESSTFLMALAAVEDGRKNGGCSGVFLFFVAVPSLVLLYVSQWPAACWTSLCCHSGRWRWCRC